MSIFKNHLEKITHLCIQKTDKGFPYPEMGLGKKCEGSQNEQTSSYKVNKSWRCNDDYS